MAGAKLRLYTAALSAAFGCGFLIYSTYVTNNVQVVGERWLNRSFTKVHGFSPSQGSLSLLWASVIASKEVGKVLGTFLIPVVAERLGRRGGLLANNVLTFVGCALCYFSLNAPYHLLMLGRFCLGVSMICGVGLASMFLIEIAPLHYRGKTGALIQIFRGFGGTMGMVFTLPEVLGTDALWTLALALPALPALLQFLVLCASPESPRHLLITENDVDGARNSLRFYQGSANVQAALKDLNSEKQRIQKTEAMSCCALLRSADFLRPVGLTVLALTNRSLAGILPVQTYSTDMFLATGLSHGAASYSTVGLGLCHLFSAVAVTLTVERFGRRSLLIGGNIACVLCLGAVAAFSAMAQNPLYQFAARILTVLSLCSFMLVYPIVASVSNIVASELCHQKIRSSAFTIGLLAYSLVGLISTFAYPLLKRYLGLSWSFIPSCACLVLTIFIYTIFLPETRGKTFENLFFEVVAEAERGREGRELGQAKGPGAGDTRPLLFGDHCSGGANSVYTDEDEEMDEDPQGPHKVA